MYERISIPAVNNSPENIKPKTYKGFSTVSDQTEQFSLYDFELIKQDITNHFHIRQGERLMQPTFGTIIWDLLFEPLTPSIKELIIKDVETIINYDPRVSIADTNIIPYKNGLYVSYSLTYTPYNITQEIIMQFDQTNGLLT